MADVGSASDRNERSLDPERSSPAGVQIALLVGFLLLAIVGAITVVVPEITDDGESEEGPSQAERSDAAGSVPAP